MPRSTAWLRRQVFLALGLAALTPAQLEPRPAHADELPAAEPAPLEELGPPTSRGAAIAVGAEGVTVRVQPSRRSAEVVARWRLRGAPGPLQLAVPSTLRPVTFAIESNGGDGSASGAVVLEDVVPLAEPLGPARELRIDPASAAVYAESPGRPSHGRVTHLLTVELPPSGEVILRASAILSSGFDRKRWRRTNYEQAHALHKRGDVFVYQFAVRGPQGTLTIVAPPNTTARGRQIDGVIYAAAAARRPPPVGLTLGIGPAVSSLGTGLGMAMGMSGGASQSARPLLVQGLLRASLDVLLPHRDALAVSVEAGSNLAAGHHVGGAVVYQVYTPVLPYLPLGGHLDVGATCDFWQSISPGLGIFALPSLRCGPRVAIGLNAFFVGLSVGVDLFPLREPDPYAPSGPGTESRLTTYYRVAILATVGL